MSATAVSRSAGLLLVISALLGAIDAHAACSATSQDVFLVGNTATDAACNYSTIQAAIDAATCPAGTRIYITDELTYEAQHLGISGKNISLIGRAPGAKCGTQSAVCGTFFPCPTVPLETISGKNHSGDSVITIRGASNVTLQYLTISDGHDSDSGSGGGVDYDGTGTLTIDTSTITDNQAGYGGGINIKGSNGPAVLQINSHSLIEYNKATTSGGGIRVEGNAQLFMLHDYTVVQENVAANFGGGVEIIGPASAYIGSPGSGVQGVIYHNIASYGGGISINGGEGDSLNANVDFFGTDPQRPVRLQLNEASNSGGAIYLDPYVSSSVTNVRAGASMCASNFRIDRNVAKEGAAIYSNEQDNLYGATGGSVDVGRVPGCDDANLGAVACSSAECNLIDGNLAEDRNAAYAPTTGATILGQDGTSVSLNHVVLRNNEGGYVLRLVGAGLSVLDNGLIVDNQITHNLIWDQYDSIGYNEPLTIDSSTLAHNQVGGYIIYDDLGVTVARSIIDEPGSTNYGGSATPQMSYVLGDDSSGLSSDPTNRVGAPAFIEPGHGSYNYPFDYHSDYRLRYSRTSGVVTASPGLDFAPAISGDDRDLRNLGYDQDLPAIPDLYGVRDVGAFEMHPYTDRVFTDSFGDEVMLAY